MARRSGACKGKLGSGKRFACVARKTGSKRLAAWIGNRKHGVAQMQKWARAARKRRHR